jgi:hypothetical protein
MSKQATESKFTFTPEPKHYYPEWGFRPDTQCVPFKMNFIFLNGGMGDYICWMKPIQWIASQATWIKGTVVVPTYFIELAKHWLADYPDFGIITYQDIKNIPNADDTPYRGPVVLQQESLNATGAHLLTCGWVYFTNKEGPPEGWNSYPALNQKVLDELELPPEAKDLKPGKYAVITTGQTTPSRFVPGNYWNPIIKYVKERGLTPVFLGKETVITGNMKNIKTKFSSETNYSEGLDLRDKTGLLQAASIMSRAAVVIGHDNGLLHLAGCTDVPIVFGYNLASPEHREPRRPVGRVYSVTLSNKELACNFCQSRTNFVIGYNFQNCFYADNKCIDMLFEQDGWRWKTQIAAALNADIDDLRKTRFDY